MSMTIKNASTSTSTSKTKTVDGREFTRKSGANGMPQFRSQCPHCGVIHLNTYDSKISIFGAQKSLVVTCNHKYMETKNLLSIVRGGCGKRYVLDVSIDIVAVSTPVEE